MSAAMQDAILAVNAGSSSLKFALYPAHDGLVEAAHISGNIEGLEAGGTPLIRLRDDDGEHAEALQLGDGDGFEAALGALDAVLARHAGEVRIRAVAHRIVHGGERFSESVVIDDDTLAYLMSLSSLAPLHQPHNLTGVHAFRRGYPHLPQIGCFDTAFHAGLAQAEYSFALPKSLRDSGIRRYGFHGLSYRYVAQRLAQNSGRAHGRVLMAHLGNGASACAMRGGKSVATTMGFSALDGLVMGTRSGAIDPGVLLHLLRSGWSWRDLERTLYRESGLQGISGVSADMRTLHASDDPNAALAVDIFLHRLVREAGALTACMQGLDVLAFTGGIGEHDAALRQRTCEALAYLGVGVDAPANNGAKGDALPPNHTPRRPVENRVVAPAAG
ncbi:MAG: acetate/propionate family kinase, partial [Burkholderiaceae bacterium]|nr:acetate/propionate family kinase [Burkholderiaceae bacterium]